jgi:ammonium transporter, Amt family
LSYLAEARSLGAQFFQFAIKTVGKTMTPIVKTALRAGCAITALAMSAAAVAADAAASAVAHPSGVTYIANATDVVGGDTAWMLTASVLVLMMTLPGLAFFYGGLVRKKNILSTMTQVFAVACAVSLLWFLFGYSLAFSQNSPWIGGLTKLINAKFLDALPGSHVAMDGFAPGIPETVFALFECAFAMIAAALIVGAFAERIKFVVAVMFCAIWSVLVYAPVAHWVWHPQGWAYAMGVRDYAGGLVVHVNAGAAALACALVVGQRRGLGEEPMNPSNLAYMLIGAGMLVVGWFGFNGGSALGANNLAGLSGVNTLLSGSVGALVFIALEWLSRGKASLMGVSTGVVAGLVAITPAAGYVTPVSALVFGVAGGLASFLGLNWLKRRLPVDDSLDVFAIHGLAGIAGSVLTPIFNRPELSGSPGKFLAELTATVVVLVYSFTVSWVLMTVLSLTIGARVSKEGEQEGLDLSQHDESLE